MEHINKDKNDEKSTELDERLELMVITKLI